MSAQKKSQKSSEASHVRSLSRALSILDAIAESEDAATLTQIAQTVELPLSTTHRLLTTLQHQRYTRFDRATTSWQIDVQAFVVGNAFARVRDVVTIARPSMRRLMEESGETVNLYVMTDIEAICMTQIESRQMMRAISRPGGRVKMHCSGVGKAMLAHLPEDELARIINAQGLPSFTERTIVTMDGLKGELARIRSRGYSIDNEEFAVGLRCVAAAILDEHNVPVAAISLSGPTVRLVDERVEKLGSLVYEAARTATLEVGGRLPRR